jgi:hypothetical protein
MSEKVNLSATFSEPDHLATNYRKPEDQPEQGDPLAFDISEYNAQQAQNVQDAYNARTDTDVETRIKRDSADFIVDGDNVAVKGGMQARYAQAAGSRETIGAGATEHSDDTSEKRTPSTELELYRKAPESATPKEAAKKAVSAEAELAKPESKEMTAEEELAAIKKELADLRIKLKTGMSPQEMQALLDKAQGEFDEASAGVDELNAQYGSNQSSTDDAPKVNLVKAPKVSLIKDNRIHDKDAAHEYAIKAQEKVEAADIWVPGRQADRYAQVSANQRGGHLGRLQNGGNRFARFMQRFRREARHTAADTEVSDQRDLFRQGFDDFVVAYRELRGSDTMRGVDLVDEKLGALVELEDRIQGYREDVSYNGAPLRTNNGEIRTQTRRDRMGVWFAERWQRSGRVGKTLKVAAVPLAAGLAAGATVATAGVLPLTVAAGAAVGYGGKRIGNRIASSVSRRMSATEAGAARATQRATGRYNVAQASVTPETAEELDITEAVEAGTTREVRENQRRRNIAGMVGGIAAGIGFAGGVQIEHAFSGGNGHHVAANADPKQADPTTTTQPPHGGGHTAPVTGGHEASTAGMPDPNQYPWEVAHGVTPGHEMSTIQQAMDAYNKVHSGAGLHFVNLGNTVQIHNAHGAALNAAQQTAFNKAMELGLAA